MTIKIKKYRVPGRKRGPLPLSTAVPLSKKQEYIKDKQIQIIEIKKYRVPGRKRGPVPLSLAVPLSKKQEYIKDKQIQGIETKKYRVPGRKRGPVPLSIAVPLSKKQEYIKDKQIQGIETKRYRVPGRKRGPVPLSIAVPLSKKQELEQEKQKSEKNDGSSLYPSWESLKHNPIKYVVRNHIKLFISILSNTYNKKLFEKLYPFLRKFILSSKRNSNLTNPFGKPFSILMLLIMYGKTNDAKQLIKNGANIDYCFFDETKKISALFIARKYRNQEMISFIKRIQDKKI